MTEKWSNEWEQKCRDLEENWKHVQEEIAKAALRAGKTAEDITLLAATKTVPAAVVNHGIRLGIRHIGENRVQEFLSKEADLLPCDRQFIGHLQTNKVRQLIGRVSMIQSVDSEKLLAEISRLSLANGLCTDILLEVNIGGEESKSGVAPEALEELAAKAAQTPGVRVRGLMAIPPAGRSSAETRHYFEKMTQYFIDMRAKKSDNGTMDYLSMGMSADYALAIEAGANMVRVGSALFGAREYPAGR